MSGTIVFVTDKKEVPPTVKIAVVGSGPGGLSCAARAAEHGVSHVLLEAEVQLSNTIFRYQKGKYVMAEPGVLPLRSPVRFNAGKRETILDAWGEDLAKHKVNVRYRSGVTKIAGQKGAFELTTAAGEVWRAEHVVLCIGLQGNLRKLGVPARTCRESSNSSTTPRPTRGKPSSWLAAAMPPSRTRSRSPRTAASS